MLKQQIQEDIKNALKAGDKDKRLVLGTLNAAIKNRELTKRGQLSKTITDATELEQQSQLTDDEIVEVIASEVKKRKESIEQFKAGGRQELVEKEQLELDILSSYLPQQLTEEEIRAAVNDAIAHVGATSIKDMGKVVGQIMGKYKGKVDGSILSGIVKEYLK